MNTIEPNDLAQVIRWPCCRGALGAIFLVKEVIRIEGGIQCRTCGARHPGPHLLASTGCGGVAPVKWIQRYKTPAELGLGERATTATRS